MVHVDTYQDRPDLQHMGVGHSFYTKLHTCAAELGFRFISGRNGLLRPNLSFFTHELGRVQLRDIKPKLRNQIIVVTEKGDLKHFTIDFLLPGDREFFVQKK